MCKIEVRFAQSPESCNVFEYALKAEVVSAEGITPKIFVYHRSPKGLDGNSFAEFDHVATPVDLQEIPEDAASDTVPWYRTNRVTVWLRNASDLETAKKLLVNDISWLQKAYNHLSSENDFTLQDTICFNGDGEHWHPSKEQEDSMQKRIDKIEEDLMNKIDKDVMSGVDISANTADGMRDSVEKIGNVLGATIRSFAAFLCLSCMTVYGAEVYKAEFNTLDLDYRPSVVTNVTFDGLAMSSNTYTKAETDAKIVELSPAPGNYSAVSNAAMNAVTTNVHGTAELNGRSHGLFLHPDFGQIEWQGPDVSAYINLPRKSGTFALTSDIPSTNGFFRSDEWASLPDAHNYLYGRLYNGGFYNVNLGVDFRALSANYILPGADNEGQNIYLASTGYVQGAVAASTNRLPTVEYVDSAIDRLAAYYITANANGDAFPTLRSLTNAAAYWSGGEPRTPTRNDYAVVLADESHGGAEWRYIYAVAADGVTGQWEAQYPIETNDYDALSNRPQINGVTLGGTNNTAQGLGLIGTSGGIVNGLLESSEPLGQSWTGLGVNGTVGYYGGIRWGVRIGTGDNCGFPVLLNKNGAEIVIPSSVGTLALLSDIPESVTPETVTGIVDNAISTNNPYFVSAVLAAPLTGAPASDLAEIGEYGSYGTVGAAILALIAGLAALKRRIGNAETAISALAPKYPMVPVTPSNGTLTVSPYMASTYTAGDSAAAFTVAVGTGTTGMARDCELVIDCTATGAVAPTVTWPATFHPRTDAATDFACEAGTRNVYFISEFASGEFAVGGWQETAGGNA